MRSVDGKLLRGNIKGRGILAEGQDRRWGHWSEIKGDQIWLLSEDIKSQISYLLYWCFMKERIFWTRSVETYNLRKKKKFLVSLKMLYFYFSHFSQTQNHYFTCSGGFPRPFPVWKSVSSGVRLRTSLPFQTEVFPKGPAVSFTVILIE